jgi:hypothetical protein
LSRARDMPFLGSAPWTCSRVGATVGHAPPSHRPPMDMLRLPPVRQGTCSAFTRLHGHIGVMSILRRQDWACPGHRSARTGHVHPHAPGLGMSPVPAARRLDMLRRRTVRQGTCSALTRPGGHIGVMSILGRQNWACPAPRGPRTGHVPRPEAPGLGMSRAQRRRDWTCPLYRGAPGLKLHSHGPGTPGRPSADPFSCPLRMGGGSRWVGLSHES